MRFSIASMSEKLIPFSEWIEAFKLA